MVLFIFSLKKSEFATVAHTQCLRTIIFEVLWDILFSRNLNLNFAHMAVDFVWEACFQVRFCVEIVQFLLTRFLSAPQFCLFENCFHQPTHWSSSITWSTVGARMVSQPPSFDAFWTEELAAGRVATFNRLPTQIVANQADQMIVERTLTSDDRPF